MTTRLRPGAWALWLAAVCVYAFTVANPLLLTVALGAVLLVHAARPRGSDPGPVRTFLVAGVALLALRLALVALLPNPGRTILVSLPHVALPPWLGGLALGGDVTAEVLASAAGEGLRLLLVLVAFGVVNASVDATRYARSLPGAMRDAGLVVSIALAFAPGVLRTVRDVRDAQILRGERGLRTLTPSLLVPVLGLSLERAFLLAESMDARGYGRDRATLSRPAAGASLALVAAGLGVWVAGHTTPAALLVAAGGAGLVWTVHAAARSGPNRPVVRRRWRLADAGVAAAACAAVAVTAASGAAGWSAYPVLHVPSFGPLAAAATLAFAAPALEQAR